MIKNDRQYRITKAQLEKFVDAGVKLKDVSANQSIHPLLLKAQADAIISQADELRFQIEEYDLLKSGRRRIITVESFEKLPEALIKARIASGWSQKELADKLNLPEQQIQRYEATDYASASLTRLREIVSALNLKVRQDVFLPDAPLNKQLLFSRLEEFGFDPKFVSQRLIPPMLTDSLQRATSQDAQQPIVLQIANIVGRILDISPHDIFSSDKLGVLPKSAGHAMRFKVKAGTSQAKVSAYTFYANHLAILAADLVSDLPIRDVCTNAAEVRSQIIATYGDITFNSILRYTWNLGIPVLPLQDSGAFHGAMVRISGRNIIVLKQKTNSASRWAFDLLHELYHAGETPAESELSVIEEEETSDARRESIEEKRASKFAGDVLLDCRAEQLAKLCSSRSRGAIQRLKITVGAVASEENVPVDALANYLAFRLSVDDKHPYNWWGTAATLQPSTEDPWKIARDLLMENVQLEKLNEVDRGILRQAFFNLKET